MKTLLITGGAGYIGSHTTVLLEQLGFRTVIFDNFSNADESALEGIEQILGYRPLYLRGDLRDRASVDATFAAYDFDGVIHFAGLKAVGESCEKPFLYYENNILGSLNLFESMRKYNVRDIVFSSSATVYAAGEKIPLNESSRLGTSNPYGSTKLIIEHILEDLASTQGFRAIALRYFNPIGAHPSGHIGESPRGVPNNLLPYILDVAVGAREKVRVFGSDYPTRDGTGVRDYIDVNDLAEAHRVAFRKLGMFPETGGFRAVNIGTGNGTSVLEMIQFVEQVSGRKIPYEIVDRRSGDLAEVVADVSLAREWLGWTAKRGVKEAVRMGWKFRR